MTQDIFKFSGFLILILSVVFLIHISTLHFNNFPLFSSKIVAAYVVNIILAIGIYTLMLLLKNKYQSQLGFIFMLGSFIKFIIFFIVCWIGERGGEGREEETTVEGQAELWGILDDGGRTKGS